MNDLLFIYGTLLDEDNEYAVYLKKNSKPYLYGKVKGKLFDLGEYPGAILSDEGNQYIYGNILKINDPEKVFPLIDNYEGFGQHQPQPNEFIRITTLIETETGLADCWIYLYNLSVEGLTRIEDGWYIK